MADTYKRKYNVNERFFDKWTPEMAWVLGLFYADGNLDLPNRRIRIGLKDIETLQKIKKALKSNHPFYEDKRTKNWKCLAIGSVKLCNSLIKHGLKTRKFPNIPEKYLSHFVRGFFEGDGCSYRFNSGKYSYIRTVFNNQNEILLLNLRERLTEFAFHNVRWDKWSNVSRLITVDKNFIPWMYGGKKNWYMERKYQNYLRMGGGSYR